MDKISSPTLAEKFAQLGLDNDPSDEAVSLINVQILRAEEKVKRAMVKHPPETWLDIDIEIVRLRIAILRELKDLLADDTKQLRRLAIRRALLPWRSLLARFWRLAKMIVAMVR